MLALKKAGRIDVHVEVMRDSCAHEGASALGHPGRKGSVLLDTGS
jgi:hypothetical protein